MADFSADELSNFTRLKRLREAGYFECDGSIPMPEIVADGVNQVEHRRSMGCQPQHQTFLPHTASRANALGLPDPAATDNVKGGPAFCEGCGAMYRCQVCGGTGPGGHCLTCGGREDERGYCKNACWEKGE